jgi:hypothetical protein
MQQSQRVESSIRNTKPNHHRTTPTLIKHVNKEETNLSTNRLAEAVIR